MSRDSNPTSDAVCLTLSRATRGKISSSGPFTLCLELDLKEPFIVANQLGHAVFRQLKDFRNPSLGLGAFPDVYRSLQVPPTPLFVNDNRFTIGGKLH